MTTYIVKRILLMIPTLIFIILMIFGILQLAPGKPTMSGGGQDGAEQAQSTEARESYRIFKRQFNFDKPVFLNFRYGLDAEDVSERLETLADHRLPVCPEGAEPQGTCIPAGDKPKSSAVIDAQETVEDWGHYVVPELAEVAESAERLDVRILALNQMSANARFQIKAHHTDELTEEDEAYNRWAYQQNQKIGEWTLPPDVSAQQVDAMLQENWEPWFDQDSWQEGKKIGDHFRHDFQGKLAATFTDTRFAKYMANIAALDFGISHVDKQPILPNLWEKMKVSMTLGFFSVFFAYLISVPLGVWSAYKQHTRADQIVTILLFMLYSLPSFFTAVLLLQWFTIGNPWDFFPTGGFVGDNADQMTTLEYIGSVSYHMLLPVFCLTYGALASLSRYARTGLLDVIRADYIRTARAKGLSEPMVIIKHAVRNGMIPILTLLGTLLPAIIGGSVVLEFVFNIPGMGLYLLNSITLKDYNAIMALSLASAVLTLVGILLSDISYAIVDPRISFD